MNLENINKEIPEEFKKLSEDFSKNGFITTSLDNLIKVIQCKEPALDQFIRLSSEVVIKPFLLKSSESFLNSSGISLFVFSKFIFKISLPI